MGQIAEAGVICWDEASNGSRWMYEILMRQGKPTFIWSAKRNEPLFVMFGKAKSVMPGGCAERRRFSA